MVVHVQNDILALCGEGRREEGGGGWRGGERGEEGMGEDEGKEGGRGEEVGSEVKVHET